MKLTLRNNVVDLSSPSVMGILNVTPDSFYDGGRWTDALRFREAVENMIKDGAAIVDIGAESTRPGSESVSLQEELRRLDSVFSDVIPALRNEVLFSIDTTKPDVAEKALESGVHFINDVSGDLALIAEMGLVAASFGAGYIVMHSKGRPKTMQVNPVYEDVTAEVSDWLFSATQILTDAGVKDIVLDPGIGFGKTLVHNLSLLRNLSDFKVRCGHRPVLIGASRKSLIGQLTGNPDPEERLPGTIALNYEALLRGADILRVHDVKEAVDSIKIFQTFHSDQAD